MRGSELKSLRQRAKLGGRELANLLEIAPETVSRYENGHKPIPKTVQLAARYLCEPKPTANTNDIYLIERLRALVEGYDGER